MKFKENYKINLCTSSRNSFNLKTCQLTNKYDYKVEDVIVLYELNKRAFYVVGPLRMFTVHHHRYKDGHRFIKFTNVFS